MQIGVLGPLEVVAGGEVVEIGGARLRALLIRLVLDAGRMVTVESLSAALWPADGPADRVNALQSLVARLRAVLPDRSAVRLEPGGYRLDLPVDAVDALRFERLAREGRRALRDGEPVLAADRLREALGLWRGEALAEVAEAPYAAAVIVRLDELRLTAIEDRLEAELETEPGRSSHLVAELEELTTIHPLRERLRRLLLDALCADGRHAEALTAYEEFRTLLSDELGADPGPDLRDAHLAALRGQGERRPVRQEPGNLRAALTGLVGREVERSRIGGRLREGRLVTLVGPGGVGKTRLAATVAAGFTGEVSGGVWLVEFAPVTDPADVPLAVIVALGLRGLGPLDGSADAMAHLAERLSAIEAVIVLDNCEHLIDAVAFLAEDLLGRCPRLRILATSREPLGVAGEALFPVPPLGLPEPGMSAAEAVACPSVRLFADRAAAVQPDFAVTDDNVSAVGEICRRLDGLPLAIELAAVRLRSLSAGQLAERLGARLQLLTGGSRTALPRHRTLRAVVAWSWDLLEPGERRFAELVAVFPGTITPEAAGWVRGPAPAALDTLADLVDKSLLQVVAGETPRYRMLETIREYGLERLAETGELSRARAAHAAFFLELAERAEPHLRGPGQLPWITTLTAERDNLLAALHTATETGDAGTAVRLAAALGTFWTIRGDHAEAVSRLGLALGIPGDAPEGARTVAAGGYLLNLVLSGAYARAEPAFEAQARDTHPFTVLIEPAMALIADDPGAGTSAIDRTQPHPDPWGRAMLWLMRAMLDGNAGDMDALSHDIPAAVAAFREAGERWGLAFSLMGLADMRTMLGDFDGAIEALEESIPLLRELDSTDGAVLPRVWLAVARARRGDAGRARAELLEMVEPGAGTLTARHLASARIILGDLARHDGDLREAASQYDAARRDLDRAPTYPQLRAMLGSATGHLAVATGDLPNAQRYLEEALVLAVEMPDMPVAAIVGVGVARLCRYHGAAHEAAEVLGAAHALRGAPDRFNPDVAELAAELRRRLGERAYQAAYDRGSGSSRTGALALISDQVRRW